MDQKVIVPVEAVLTKCVSLPVGYVPTPSAPYRQHRKNAQLTLHPGPPRLSEATARNLAAVPVGSRVLIWKQDPSVSDLGTRKAFLPGLTLQGPRDARITFGEPGIAQVSPNAFGDFIVSPNTDQFDAVHTFAIVRMTLTMYQRALASNDTAPPLPWQWNSASNTAPLRVFPHGLPNVMNAYYSRSDKALKFGDFIPSGATERVYTCRSLDIVSHETGHAVLDGLKPNWLLSNNPPQTGGLHESFGDLTAIFLALSQLDQVEAVIAQTKSDLHDKTFLADLAEQFGLALGRPNGLRNADNDIKLSEAGTEVHAISQVFTGAIYDILADIFAHERQPQLEDDAAVLHPGSLARPGRHLCRRGRPHADDRPGRWQWRLPGLHPQQLYRARSIESQCHDGGWANDLCTRYRRRRQRRARQACLLRYHEPCGIQRVGSIARSGARSAGRMVPRLQSPINSTAHQRARVKPAGTAAGCGASHHHPQQGTA